MVATLIGLWALFRETLPAPANVRLGPSGVVEAWLVAGPFPNASEDGGAPNGLSTPWIGPEASARPTEGGFVTHLRDAGIPDFWRLAATDGHGVLDFDRMLRGSEPGVAYAYTALLASRSGPATINVEGSNVLRLLLNGKTVFEGGRQGSTAGKVSVNLAKGLNRLLLKVVHDAGKWQSKLSVNATFRVSAQVGVYQTGVHAEPADLRAIRAVRGKAGALDLDGSLAYDATARYAAQWIDVFYSEVAHPGAMESVLAEAARFVVASQAGDADRISDALNRANNLIQSVFDKTRAQVLTATQNPRVLMRTNVAKEDYVRVAPGGRFFAYPNGRPFPVVGFTLRLGSEALYCCDPNNPGYFPDRADQFFRHAADSGVNLIRIAIDSPQIDPFEDRTGKLSPEHIKWIDQIFLIALKHGVKLLVSAYDSPHNGHMAQVKGFLSTVAGRISQKHRWKAIIDRWGDSGVIFGWEILNEGDAWGESAAVVADDIADVGGYVKRYERGHWGRTHLMTSSTRASVPSGMLAASTFGSSVLDFTETHLYAGSSVAPTEEWDPATDIGSAARQCVLASKRPYLDGENGPAERPVADALTDSDIFSNVAWAEVTSGSAGVGLRRAFRMPDAPTDEMLDCLAGIRKFCLGVDWAKLSGAGSDPLVAGVSRRSISSGFGNANSAILWVGGPMLGGRVSLPPSSRLRSGRFRSYDCVNRKWLASGEFKNVLLVPEGLKSVAWVLTRE